ncbi:hypothetical protein MC885_002920 [Smutsia gigantea]|nr:hypothetical protein MC885_002920 [Smutsia gigantea]
MVDGGKDVYVMPQWMVDLDFVKPRSGRGGVVETEASRWKVLNYDRTKDLEDHKPGARTQPRASSSAQADAPSSEEEAVGTPAPEAGPARAAGHPSGPLSDHHCAYTILHMLSHLRPHEPRSPQGGSRELVMRVTTV